MTIIIDEFTGKGTAHQRYRWRNPEKYKAQERAGYHRMKERKGKEVALAIRRERNNISRARDPIGYLLYEAKARAKENDLEFSIEKSDIVLPERCPILDIPLFKNRGKKGPSDNSWTVDRFDNLKGYTKENIRVISWRANRLKNNATLQELEAIVNYMKT